MAAGWSVLGNCYTTSEQVVNAFTAVYSSHHFDNTGHFYNFPESISFNPATSTVTFKVRWDNNTYSPNDWKTVILQACDTDHTPTPANVVINGNGTPGIVQPPLETVTPDTKLSSISGDDIIILCAVLFASLFGFSFGISGGKGIAR
ncbi:hypothetical protein [Methylobacillus flagellatus]|uniref:hypothetical protein n=1 Tax=Methylobacillus flagellatus TaxID=405 RepID=UPI0018A17469|nr:hypothetical protein [Methylobacillus flagellatus]